MAAREVAELAYRLRRVGWPWQCGRAVVERVVEVVVPHGLGLPDPPPWAPVCLGRGGSLSPVECRVEGFPWGAFAACENCGLEESLLASWGVFWVYFWGVGQDRHEDSVCPVQDPPMGVRFEDVDGGLLGGRVQGVPRRDGQFYPGRPEVQGGLAA